MASSNPVMVDGGAGTIGYTPPNTMFLGSVSQPVANVVIGNGSTAVTPVAKLIRFTNASGVDNAAGNATIQAPLSTGAAVSASLNFAVGIPHGSDAVLQTAATIVRVSSVGVIFPTDATYDIGQSGATRPRHLYASGNGVFGGTLEVDGTIGVNVAAGASIGFNLASVLTASAGVANGMRSAATLHRVMSRSLLAVPPRSRPPPKARRSVLGPHRPRPLSFTSLDYRPHRLVLRPVTCGRIATC